MSLNHLVNPILGSRQKIFCNSCTCSEAKVADKLEVKDFFFDTQNSDVIELSSLPDQGVMGSVLKSNGDGTVQWGSDLTGGVNYTGSQPTVVNGLTVFNGTDGTTIGDTPLTTTDITDLQTDKLDKTGGTISSDLTVSGTLKIGQVSDNSFGLSGITFNNISRFNSGMRTTTLGNPSIGDVQLTSDIDGNSRQLKNNTAVYTDNLYSKFGLGNIKVNNGNLDFQNLNSIQNLNNTQTQTISSTDGVSINVQDDINMGLFDINNCNDIRVNALTTNTVPNIVANNSIDMNNNDLLDVGNMNVSKINNITPVGGLYCGISDGVVINQSSGQTDLLPVSSVGSLVIPANGFKIGDAFHIVVAGIFPTESKNDDITVDIKQNGTTLASINLELEDFNVLPSNFELEMDFVIRSVGVSGSIASNLDFSFNKSVSKDFKGTRSTDITTIDTTTTSTLSVLATVNGGGSSIQSRLAYLRKQY
jgi:hypothetical protein